MIFLYLIAVFISFFILYAVARHDFVLLRQSISLRTVFDNALINFLGFFVVSRIFFIFYTRYLDYFNPLKFLYITYYWGLLPYAGVIFYFFSTLFLFRKKKNKLRILDIYFISLSPILILDILLKGNSLVLLSIKIVSLIVLIIFYGWFIAIHNKFSTKDGFITGMTIITYSLVTLAFSLAQNGILSQDLLWFNAVLVVITVLSTVFLVLVQKDTFNKQ